MVKTIIIKRESLDEFMNYIVEDKRNGGHELFGKEIYLKKDGIINSGDTLQIELSGCIAHVNITGRIAYKIERYDSISLKGVGRLDSVIWDEQ